MSRSEKMAMGTHPDRWICICGNSAMHGDGFAMCDKSGVTVDEFPATQKTWPEPYYRCTNCDKVFFSNKGEPVFVGTVEIVEAMKGHGFRPAVEETIIIKTYTFRGFYIPSRMMHGLKRWVEKGDFPGDFLTAVLENDLSEAVGRADDENLINLPAFVGWLYNEAPAGCHGSKKICKAWHEAKKNKGE